MDSSEGDGSTDDVLSLMKGSFSGKGEFFSFVSNAAHRLRSTLTVMRIYTELIQSGTYGPIEGDLVEKVGTIEASIDEMSANIDSMQDLIMATDLPYERSLKVADLYAITYEVMKGLTTPKRERIKLSLSGSPIVDALVDEQLARKAIGHLVSYSMASSDAQGVLTDLLVEETGGGPSVSLLSYMEPMGKGEMVGLISSMIRDTSALSVQDWRRLSLPLAVHFGRRIGASISWAELDDGRWEYRMTFVSAPPTT